MAKNPFFLRGSVTTLGNGTYAQTEIDLGSYTNLGSSKPEVLKIHKAHLYITDVAGNAPEMDADKAATAQYQITTQSQTAMVLATDDSFVLGGVGAFRNPDSNQEPPAQAWEQGIMPQDYVNGYTVAVPSLFLGGFTGADWSESVLFSIVLECTTEPMSKANAVSLAISQQ